MRMGAQARAKDFSQHESAAEPKDERTRFVERVQDYGARALATVPSAKVEETARQWLAKAKLDAEDNVHSAQLLFVGALVLAGYLLVFTPSLLGAAPVERFVRRHRAEASREERVALDALAKSSFRLIRLQRRTFPAVFVAEDLASGESLAVFDEELPDGAIGVALGVWLAPLPDGSFMTIGPLTPLDSAAFVEAMTFVRAGRGLSNSQRCAAAIYKHVVRHGGLRLDGVNDFPDDLLEESAIPEGEAEFDDLDRWAFAIETRLEAGQEISPEEAGDARRLTSFSNLVQALDRSVISRRYGRERLAEAFARLAFFIMETYERRAAAGAGGEEKPLEFLAGAIDRAINEEHMSKETRALYDDLWGRIALSGKGGAGGGEKDAEIVRVLLRIQALRAKTVEQGCTEQEALASAKKVAELLDRYGLSLGEVELREQACEGVGLNTGRKRRAPIDECIPTVPYFCDCRVWTETSQAGEIRYIFFGLPVDVEAAHYLYDLIVIAFETETMRYKREDKTVMASARRDGVRSFQIGLAHGIAEKLKTMKAERDAALRQSSGRDLVPLKASVIDEELDKLGYSFSKQVLRRKRVVTGAYQAGREAGRKFVPRPGIEETSTA